MNNQIQEQKEHKNTYEGLLGTTITIYFRIFDPVDRVYKYIQQSFYNPHTAPLQSVNGYVGERIKIMKEEVPYQYLNKER